MKRLTFVLAFGIASLFELGRAEAQQLGTKGDAIFGAERIFGIRGERYTIDYPAPVENTEIDTTAIGFGFSRAQDFTYNIPRIAFDYMIIDKLSIGGALLYSNLDVEDEDGDDASIADFEISPRVGYLHMFGDVIGIWPRGGLSYHSTSLEDTFHATTWALNIECMFPIVVRQHFGFLVGFAFDQSFIGEIDWEDDPDTDLMVRSIGLQAGLFGWL
jgi:hypothetical protein